MKSVEGHLMSLARIPSPSLSSNESVVDYVPEALLQTG